MSIQSSRGIKELSVEDKLKIANLIKELARYESLSLSTSSDLCCRLGHEKEQMEGKLEQERRLFETQMKTVLTDYDKLMKDNQSKISTRSFCWTPLSVELLTRYNETKNILHEYEKKSQASFKMPTNEFPNPQRVRSHTDVLLVDSAFACSLPRPSMCMRRNQRPRLVRNRNLIRILEHVLLMLYCKSNFN